MARHITADCLSDNETYTDETEEQERDRIAFVSPGEAHIRRLAAEREQDLRLLEAKLGADGTAAMRRLLGQV